MASKPKALEFERALNELESLVKKLEDGQLSLEESLKQFERAMALAKACQSALTAAEQKIETITALAPASPDEPDLKDEHELANS